MSDRSILVVDDDSLTRETICEVLMDSGWSVSSARRGLEAWERLERLPSDLVVSDIDMPDISGFELLDRMHRAQITSPLVFISARGESASALATAAGAAGYFTKPVQLAPFTERIAALLG